MSTAELMLTQMKVAYEVDFITPDSTLGPSFVAHLLQRFLEEEAVVLSSKDIPTIACEDVMAPLTPIETMWVVSEDSDISDHMGGGIRLRTAPMHWLLGGPTAMMNIAKFVRENGISDETCRFRITYFCDGLHALPIVKFLFLLDEDKQIKVWEKFGPFLRKSHLEHMAAALHTNLYWQDGRRWLAECHHDIEMGSHYGIDFGNLSADRLDVDIIQGPHWEHRTNAIANLMSELGDALRLSYGEDNAWVERAQAFWTKHVEKVHPAARYMPPPP